MRGLREPGEHRVLAVHLLAQPDQLIRERTIKEIGRIEIREIVDRHAQRRDPINRTQHTKRHAPPPDELQTPEHHQTGELEAQRRGKRREGAVTLHEHTFDHKPKRKNLVDPDNSDI
jgi:hypothetical protein